MIHNTTTLGFSQCTGLVRMKTKQNCALLNLLSATYVHLERHISNYMILNMQNKRESALFRINNSERKGVVTTCPN